MLDLVRSVYHRVVPESVRHTHAYRRVRQVLWNRRLKAHFGVEEVKYAREAGFWEQVEKEHGRIPNAFYERRLLQLAAEDDASFLDDKIVVDFGCGPAGSLHWANNARLRVGVDVLVDVYGRFGIRDHDMVYVESSETRIPLPTEYADVVFSLNAMDHCDDFEAMSDEVRRILIPGGLFIGSFNLHEPRSFSEPQTLTEARVRSALLDHLKVEKLRIGERGPKEDQYAIVAANTDPRPLPSYKEGFLWVTARKPGA